LIGPIRDRRTFQALRAQGIRVRSGALAATHLAEEGAPGTRVAFAITKRVGGAVTRNRLRRRLRAVIVELDRTGAATVPTGALLVAAGPEAVDRGTEELRNDVQRLLAALEDRRNGGSRR
jgi:ribonuclease P protein component